MSLKSYTLFDDLQHATGLAADKFSVYWTLFLEGMEAIVRGNTTGTKPEIIVDSGKYVKKRYKFVNFKIYNVFYQIVLLQIIYVSLLL